MKTNPFLGSVLLIVGTSVGAGMLALPVSTAAYGFFPSIALFVVCWLCMMVSGLLILEANLWLNPGANLVSMAQATLGVWGKAVTWGVYLLLFYSLMAAYISGMGDLVSHAVESQFYVVISTGVGSLGLILLVGLAISLGLRSVDYVNRLFFFGKLVTYVAVVIAIIAFVNVSQLATVHFSHAWLALPIVITSFGFQHIVPVLRVYLQDDMKKLRLAIIIGSTISLFIYSMWEFVILGAVPTEGNGGLMQIWALGQPATGLAASLDHLLNKSWISTLFKLFTFFAIMTSFIGVSCGLFDFLLDSFDGRKTVKGRSFALMLTFLPPLVFAFAYPDGFIFALGYAGVFLAILSVVLPVCIIWSGRYRRRAAIRAFASKSAHIAYRANVNKWGLALIFLFGAAVILAQLWR